MIVQLSAIRPNSAGGVEGVAVGLGEALLLLDPETKLVASSLDQTAWAEVFEIPPDAIRVNRKDTPTLRKFGRLLTPKSKQLLINSSVGKKILRSNSKKATETLGKDEVVWNPFHRTPCVGKKSIVTVHDLRVFETDFEDKMSQEFIVHNVAKADALVVSWRHPYLDLLRRFPEARSKTFLVPLPVLNSGTYSPREYLSTEELHILVPAGTSVHKNQELVIGALAQLPNARVVFTGPTHEPRVSELQDLADSFGVRERIAWRGYVSADELDSLYDWAHVLVMPSRWEAASGPVFEAIARGIPTVACRVPPLVEQFNQFGFPDHLVDADDSEELAREIEVMSANLDLESRCLEGIAKELSSRTWVDCANDYLKVANWVAGSGMKPVHLQPRFDA